jgi:hypothetical protein
MDPVRGQQGMVQGGMIVHPQIAPEPYQRVSQSHLLCAESMSLGIFLSTILCAYNANGTLMAV